MEKIIHFLERFFKKKTIFKYGFYLSSSYKRSTGRVYYVSDDLQTVKVKIPLSYKNRNYKGTIFGGSMFSSTDPIFMIQLITLLGPNYVVWDKAASIKFIRPANQTLYAEFIISNEFLLKIKEDISLLNETEYTMQVNLVDEKNTIYAKVERIIYVASKEHYKRKRLKFKQGLLKKRKKL